MSGMGLNCSGLGAAASEAEPAVAEAGPSAPAGGARPRDPRSVAAVGAAIPRDPRSIEAVGWARPRISGIAATPLLALSASVARAIAPCQQGRPPKLLRKQAADGFALHILTKCLPLIDVALDLDIEEQDLHLKLEALRHLRQMKDWYWEQTVNWLGHRHSNNRINMSNSLMDVLDWKKTYKRVLTLHRLVVQLLFCVEIGIVEKYMERYLVEAPQCHQLQKLLRAVGPIGVQKMHDTCLKFEDPNVLATIFQMAPYLYNIHFYVNLNSTALYYLRIQVANLKVISIDIENVYLGNYSNIESHLYKAFFGSMNKEQLMQCVCSNGTPTLSFNHLAEIVIQYEIFPGELAELMFCLHHYYNNVRIIISNLVAIPFDSSLKKSAFVTPTLVMSKMGAYRKYCIYFYGERIESKFVEYFDNNTLREYEHITNFCLSISNVQHLMTQKPLDALRYIFYNQRIAVSINLSLGDLAGTLRELYLFGLVADSQQEHNLVQTLNKCYNLYVLSLQVKVVCNPVMRLNKLEKLERLSISIATFATLNMFDRSPAPWTPAEVYIMMFMRGLIAAATNVKTLEIPGKNLDELVLLESFSRVQTLTITEGKTDYLISCLRNLPFLVTLVLSKTFGYYKYLRLKKFFKCTDLKVLYQGDRLVHCSTDFSNVDLGDVGLDQ